MTKDLKGKRRFRKCAVWVHMMNKRLWRKPLFIFSLLLIPVLVLGLRFVSGQGESALKVAIYERKAPSYYHSVAKRLVKESKNSISFYTVKSEKDLYQLVQKDEAECGYIFGEKGELICVSKEESVLTKVVHELVYSKLYPDLSYQYVKDYLNKHATSQWSVQNEKDWKMRYEKYRKNEDSMFRFEYLDGSENEWMKGETSYLLLPVRGILAVLVLLVGMTGTLFWYQDEERGTFSWCRTRQKNRLAMLYLFLPTLQAGVLAVLSIFLSGTGTSIAGECLRMGIYIIFVIGWCNLLRQILPGIYLFLSSMPILILSNLIFCPVFIDITNMWKGFHTISKFLPVNYYLNSLHSRRQLVYMCLLGFLLCIGSNLINVRKRN